MPEFGEITRKVEVFEKYKGQYVILYIQPNHTFAGKIEDVDDEWITLQPSQVGEWDIEKGLVRKLIEKPSLIRKSDITAIEPTTEKNLIIYCEYQNKHPSEKEQNEQINRKAST